MLLFSRPEINFFIEDHFPVHSQDIDLEGNTICEDVVMGVVKCPNQPWLHIIDDFLHFSQVPIKEISWGGQIEVLTVSFTEIEEELVSHIITVLDLLFHLFRDFILNFLIFAQLAIH